MFLNKYRNSLIVSAFSVSLLVVGIPLARQAFGSCPNQRGQICPCPINRPDPCEGRSPTDCKARIGVYFDPDNYWCLQPYNSWYTTLGDNLTCYATYFFKLPAGQSCQQGSLDQLFRRQLYFDQQC